MPVLNERNDNWLDLDDRYIDTNIVWSTYLGMVKRISGDHDILPTSIDASCASISDRAVS